MPVFFAGRCPTVALNGKNQTYMASVDMTQIRIPPTPVLIRDALKDPPDVPDMTGQRLTVTIDELTLVNCILSGTQALKGAIMSSIDDLPKAYVVEPFVKGDVIKINFY
jgi:hypothetical protein